MFPMLTSNIITGDVLLFRLSAWTALIFTSTAEYETPVSFQRNQLHS